MTTRRPSSTTALCTIVGLASAAHAYPDTKDLDLVPTRAAGTLYINLQTGERTLTRYDDNAKVALPEFETDHTRATTALFDYWMSLDPNPCWDDPRADGFGFTADAPSDSTGTAPITEPIAGFDFGDLPFDSKITGVIINTATLATESIDSNNDGTPDTGIDVVAAFYDALSEGNRTSIAPPTAAVRIQAIPGQIDTTDNIFESYDLILDFGNAHFELGDSDGQNLGELRLDGAAQGLDLSALITSQVSCETTPSGGLINCQTISIPNPNADGLADFQYLQHYAQFDTNDKVTDVSTFIGLGAADGIVVFETFTTYFTTLTPNTTPLGTVTTTVLVTVVETLLVPDPLPSGQSAFEGIGIAALGPGADLTNLDWSSGGCCFWYGGLDCDGYLDQLNPDIPRDPSWYNYTPFAQTMLGLLSDAPPDQCATINFERDGILDNADIQAFVKAFLFDYDLVYNSDDNPQFPAQTADLNADGVTDNADIATFIERFLACTG